MVLPTGYDTRHSPTQRSDLQRLPLHVLTQICGYLGRFHNDSLLAFAQTCRTCHHAAELDRFRCIQITVGLSIPISQTVRRLRDVLNVGGRMNLVRVLRIRGAESIHGAIEYLQHRPVIQVKMAEWDDEDEELRHLCSPVDQTRTYRHGYVPWPEEIMKKWNNGFMPIADLCRDLVRLQDIVWAVTERFPPSLLASIHLNHPTSRLHMPTFLLRSLITEEDSLDLKIMDPDEVALATSPCLYSLVVETADYSEFDWVDHNHDAVLSMLRGAAPRLTHVLLRRAWTLWGPEEELLTPSRPRWLGFPEHTWPAQKVRKRNLQSLCIDRVPATPDLLVEWANHTDFRELRSLVIKGTISTVTIQHLLRLASRGTLDSLHSLSLLDSNKAEYRGEYGGVIGESTAKLVQTLKPLQSLKLNHRLINQEVAEAVLSRHADSLQILSLLPQYQMDFRWVDFLTELARDIAQRCLKLKELETIVPKLRDKGGQDQVRVYRSLGELPQLKRLTLRLDCAVRYSPSFLRTILVLPTRSSPDYTAVQEAFKAVASDETFELEIASIMSHDNSEMHTLVLDPSHFPPLYPADISDRWGHWVGRRWATQKTAAGDTEMFETGDKRRGEVVKVLKGVCNSKSWRGLDKVVKRVVLGRMPDSR